MHLLKQSSSFVWQRFRRDCSLTIPLASVLLAFLFSTQTAFAADSKRCVAPFLHNSALSTGPQLPTLSGISTEELTSRAATGMMRVPEFEYIRKTAEQLGLRVWLFGGTASSFLHYVKWDLARQKGLMDLQEDRFDYDFTNIFRSTQDLDIVVDATPEVAKSFQNTLAQRYPHFLGDKANKWEVRTLKHRMGTPGQIGFKEALLNDADFNLQNTDSNSVGMVEITTPPKNESIIRDLRHWDETKSVFLDDTLNNQISYFRSDKHFTTFRAKAGENPEILSVLRLLVKAFQYELKFSEKDKAQLKKIAVEFNPGSISNAAALRRIQDTSKKLVMHAVDIEYAMNILDELGLRTKLIAMGKKEEPESFAWWLNKEPLRSKKVGQGKGKTAKELGIEFVAHETKSFLAHESITRSHTGEPNVLISRQGAKGEKAVKGDGFYTQIGKRGSGDAETGITIRFTVDPNAREGTDFTVHNEVVLFQNKQALQVIPESFNLSLDDLIRIAENKQALQIDDSDSALLEIEKRKLTAARLNGDLDKLLKSKSKKDHEKVNLLLTAFQNSSISKLISEDVMSSVAKNVYERISSLAESKNDDESLQYIRTVGPILKTLDNHGLLSLEHFIEYLKTLSQSENNSFKLRKAAVFEILTFPNVTPDNFENYLHLRRDFSEIELKSILDEFQTWILSSDVRKSNFALSLNQKWSNAVMKGNVNALKALVDSGLIESINHKNISGVSVLQLSAYYQRRAIIDWLIANPEFNFNAKNKLGFTEIEQLRLSGRSKLADAIVKKRPEIKARTFEVKERNLDHITEDYPEGAPFVDFVRIEPGSFMMSDGKSRVFTTITKPFEFMSVGIDQETYATVAMLLLKYFPKKYRNIVKINPSHFRGDKRPVENVSADVVDLWITGLNELSELDEQKVQLSLSNLFPGHKKSARYELPTEAQWEFVARLGGLAEGRFPHGNSTTGIVKDVADGKHHLESSEPVGFKKPVFYNGHPIYDLQGNVDTLVRDPYDELKGGIDPLGPITSPIDGRISRGGGSRHKFYATAISDYRGFWSPDVCSPNLSFRLVRVLE